MLNVLETSTKTFSLTVSVCRHWGEGFCPGGGGFCPTANHLIWGILGTVRGDFVRGDFVLGDYVIMSGIRIYRHNIDLFNPDIVNERYR